MFGEFNEAAQPKNLTRQIFNRIELFSCTNTSASNSVFEAVRQSLQITVCEKVCGQTNVNVIKKALLNNSNKKVS